MSKVRVVGNSFACLCLFASAASAATIWNVTLSGDQEVPPVVTSRTGTATVELNDDQSLLTYTIDTFGFDIGGIKTPNDATDDITGAHIHAAPAGANGSVVFGIFSPQHDKNNRFITINGDTGLIQFRGVWDAADVLNGAQPLADQLTALLSGGLYLNVHTTAFPGGEIRGQIVPEPSAVVLAGLALVGLMAARRRRSVSR